jgi:hypothetical protein
MAGHLLIVVLKIVCIIVQDRWDWYSYADDYSADIATACLARRKAASRTSHLNHKAADQKNGLNG